MKGDQILGIVHASTCLFLEGKDPGIVIRFPDIIDETPKLQNKDPYIQYEQSVNTHYEYIPKPRPPFAIF